MQAVHIHEFPSVKDYLHHRAPYLLLQEIEALGDRFVDASTAISGDEHFISGHFPGAPIGDNSSSSRGHNTRCE